MLWPVFAIRAWVWLALCRYRDVAEACMDELACVVHEMEGEHRLEAVMRQPPPTPATMDPAGRKDAPTLISTTSGGERVEVMGGGGDLGTGLSADKGLGRFGSAASALEGDPAAHEFVSEAEYQALGLRAKAQRVRVGLRRLAHTVAQQVQTMIKAVPTGDMLEAMRRDLDASVAEVKRQKAVNASQRAELELVKVRQGWCLCSRLYGMWCNSSVWGKGRWCCYSCVLFLFFSHSHCSRWCRSCWWCMGFVVLGLTRGAATSWWAE